MTDPIGASRTGLCDTLLATLSLTLATVGAVLLWRAQITTNMLVLVALATGCGTSGWYAQRAKQARHRVSREQIDEQQYERDRALRLALHAPADTLIGDTERDAVREALSEAMQRGRISLVEHMDRLDAVNDARTPAGLRDALKGLL